MTWSRRQRHAVPEERAIRTGARTLVTAGLLALLASGCATAESDRYRLAIADAAVAAPAKQLPVRAIPGTDPVLVVSWTDPGDPLACTDRPGCEVPRAAHTRTHGWTWVTIDPELRERCQAWGASEPDLGRRVREVLGLQPKDVGRVFVVFAVPRAALARPCLDTTLDDQGRLVCALTASRRADEMSAFAAGQMAASYFIDESPAATYPWGYPYTRLGYTYDWGRDARPDHYGASEFVVPANTPVTVVARQTTAEFCKR